MGNPLPAYITPVWEVYPRLTKSHLLACQQLGISYLHAQLLSNRGIKMPEAMQSFIEARYESLLDPLGLIDMERALERIEHALATKEHITVFGDFDADGVTSAALMTRALRMLEHPGDLLDAYIPHRTQSERGLSQVALEQLKAGGTTLIITTDCGSSDVEAVTYAKTLGIDIIITDHHQPPEQLPQAFAVINPWRSDCTYGERYLCGVGIAFKVAQALFRIYDREREVRELLDLVAIGTIADVAQLLGENHTLVRSGLQQLNNTTNAGLQALIQVAGMHAGGIRERDVAYGLAPRLNAAGRMKHADLALQLLITDNWEEALGLAWELEMLNRMRKEQTAALMELASEQAHSQVSDPVVLVEGPQDTYHEGIIGLVAGKLAEALKQPVFILSKGERASRGSARSYGGANIMQALQARADLFAHYGGHPQAAGFTIDNANIEALREHLCAWFAASFDVGSSVVAGAGSEGDHTRQGDRRVDLAIARPELLDYAAYVTMSELGPFGAGNPEPVFRMENLRLVGCWVSGPDGKTLQVRLQYDQVQFRGSYKGGGGAAARFEMGTVVYIIFCLSQATGGASEQDIFLQILHMERVGGI